ncbi:MAG TPA: hypothetical protein VK466_18480 [Terriglobales bacterium]|nr:hypothetical protein [Terriglobales bacterium]
MKLSTVVLTALAVVVVAFLIWSFAAYPGRHTTATGATVYDPAHEVLLAGTVKDVQNVICPESAGTMGAHLLLQTSKGNVWVHLAPTGIMQHRNLAFIPGEQIRVLGSEVRVFDRHDVLAREVYRGNEIVVLRDTKGQLLPQ